MLGHNIRTQRKQHVQPHETHKIRHEFMKVYGWISSDDWQNKVNIEEVYDLYPLVLEEIRKQEELRLCSLMFYGVKNPK